MNDQSENQEDREPKVNLQSFPRSPRVAELKVTYRSRKDAERTAIRNAEDAATYLRAVWNRHTIELVEEFVLVCLNGNHRATGWVKVSSGGLNAAAVDPRVIFAIALQTASSAIIVAHNHPSGSLEPSPQDIATARTLKETGKVLGVSVLDHLILTRDGFLSLAEQGLM